MKKKKQSKLKYPRALLVRMTDHEKVLVENESRKQGYGEGEVVRRLVQKHL